jgi:hypothetical protein
MIFLFNGRILDFDKFKNYIDSLSSYPWKKAIFYYEYDDTGAIEEFLSKSFEHTKLLMRNRINTKQKDWIEAIDTLDNNLVWLSCSYDLVFVDNNYDHLNEVLGYAKGYGIDKLFSISICNWRESLRKCVMHDLGPWDPVANDHSAPTFHWLSNCDCDSYQIVTKGLLKEWFATGDYPDNETVRPEDLLKYKKIVRPWKVFVPSREICRKVKDICEENNFIDETVDKNTRKERLIRYYLHGLPKNSWCLANPRFEPGIFNRVLKHYGFKRINK